MTGGETCKDEKRSRMAWRVEEGAGRGASLSGQAGRMDGGWRRGQPGRGDGGHPDDRAARHPTKAHVVLCSRSSQDML